MDRCARHGGTCQVQRRFARSPVPSADFPLRIQRCVEPNLAERQGYDLDVCVGIGFCSIGDGCCCGCHVGILRGCGFQSVTHFRSSLSKQTENHVDKAAPLDACLDHRRAAPGEKSRGRFFVSAVGSERRKPGRQNCCLSVDLAPILTTPIVISPGRTSGCDR